MGQGERVNKIKSKGKGTFSDKGQGKRGSKVKSKGKDTWDGKG